VSSQPPSEPSSVQLSQTQPPQVQSPETVEQAIPHHAAASVPEMKKAPFPFFRTLAFSVFVAGLSIFFLFVDFQGISTAEGMEQADVARSFARGDGLSTQFLRPISLAKKVESSESSEIPMTLKSSSHGPLNSPLNAGLLAISGTDYDVDFQYRIFFPDRVFAAGAIALFWDRSDCCSFWCRGFLMAFSRHFRL